ncbi:PIN domain-containing protein [Rhizobium sp. RCC_161_2]|uniref:PIN domain-containing protein n=1 Tax=Rhizobium sp. RCC_161_2 TaxID=3239219 RepID=UPI0035245261
MTRYLLDTNIVSNAIKPEPSRALLAWYEEQPDSDLFVPSLAVAEIQRGILIMPTGRRRNLLEAWFSSRAGPQAVFAGRILAFDERAGLVWAQLMAEGKAAGRPRDAFDMIIASVAIVNDCVLATDNERDFWGLDIVNPLRRSTG